MQTDKLAYELIMNIGLLVLVASLVSKLRILQHMILQERRKWKSQVVLSLVFAGMIILSAYTGIEVQEYNMNTRMIGAVSAGLLGGPVVGMFASFIGAAYVYLFSTPDLFAHSSAFSTVLFGLLGGGFYPYFQRGKWQYQDLFLLACFAEVCDMVTLLRNTATFMEALDVIVIVALPMTLLNSVGLLIFISIFDTLFIQQDLESSRQLKKASELSKKCLPLLREGLNNKENIHQMITIILEETEWSGVMITGKDEILEWRQKKKEWPIPDTLEVPNIGKEVMASGKFATRYYVPVDSPWYEVMKDYCVMAAPFLIKDQPVGCLIIWTKKQWIFRQSEFELLQHFVTVGSFQLAMAELERQQMMRQKAEFKALQFQVNPHFLFNALNTISCVCRENSERARELLVILAEYFRYNLDSEAYMVPMEEEIDHVRDYLEIEEARFEDKLSVTYDLPENMDVMIPTLILQPIVENAVKYGIDERGRRMVHIAVEDEDEEMVVSIRDGGKGVSPEVLGKLARGEAIGKSVGLTNVHKRMKSIYGEDHGLKITSDIKGTCVELHFTKGLLEEEAYENRSY